MNRRGQIGPQGALLMGLLLQAEREMFAPPKRPPDHIEIHHPDRWRQALESFPGLMKDGLTHMNAMAPPPGEDVYAKAAVRERRRDLAEKKARRAKRKQRRQR